MIKSDKKVSELTKSLNNPDVLIVAAAIDFLRDAEPFEGAIGLLVNHYDVCNDLNIKLLIAGFLNDLKDTNVKKEIIDSIRNTKNDDTRSMIITSCWQSGIDYSDRIDDFIDFFMTNNFDIAFECLTVIEQSVENIDQKKKKEIVGKIKKKISKQPSEKTALINELINLMVA
jgi:hypothetical protein